MCKNCKTRNAIVGENANGSDPIIPPETGISQSFLDEYALALYTGVIDEHNLSIELYGLVGDYLDKALEEGFSTSFDEGSDFEKTYLKLRSNLWHFGAAKQYTQNREILRSFVAPLETIDFKDFKGVADQILNNYNDNYLKTEFQTAVANSQSARDWGELEQDDTIHFIEYITQEDPLVRNSHARLNGATYPKNHSFWNKYFPPNGWNCRCFTINHDEDQKEKKINNPPEFGSSDMPKAFEINSGKEKVVFPNSHPYFRVAQGDKVFRENNYGLPVI